MKPEREIGVAGDIRWLRPKLRANSQKLFFNHLVQLLQIALQLLARIQHLVDVVDHARGHEDDELGSLLAVRPASEQRAYDRKPLQAWDSCALRGIRLVDNAADGD